MRDLLLSVTLSVLIYYNVQEGEVYCVDAKINFDDNAEFRQKHIFSMHDPSEDNALESRAAEVNFLQWSSSSLTC
mgnify:CR=1 FL=1